MISDSTTRQKGCITATALLILLTVCLTISTGTAFAEGAAPSFETSVSGLNVDFTYTGTASNDTIQRFVWAFGDGMSSYSENTTHTYSAGGEYNVTLKVVFWDGSSAYSTKHITLTAPFLDTETGTLNAGNYHTNWLALVVLCGMMFVLCSLNIHPLDKYIDNKAMRILYGLGIAAGIYLYLGGKIW